MARGLGRCEALHPTSPRGIFSSLASFADPLYHSRFVFVCSASSLLLLFSFSCCSAPANPSTRCACTGRYLKPHFGASIILSLSRAFILCFLSFAALRSRKALFQILLRYSAPSRPTAMSKHPVQRLVQDEALESSSNDFEEKLKAFNALGTKGKMKQFLVELNVTIPRFKDQVRLTGNVPDLRSGYCEYLRRV